MAVRQLKKGWVIYDKNGKVVIITANKTVINSMMGRKI